MRVALGVQYNGNRYHGWQKQPGLLTVQAQVEQALSQVADHPVQLYCAGRTDTGVHGSGQVVHFDTKAKRDNKAWVFGVNTYLPKDISIIWSKFVSDEFHARFSALSRSYRYFLCNQRHRPALFMQNCAWHYIPLDVQSMHESAQLLVGEHDFSALRASGCQAKSPVRTIEMIAVSQQQNMIIIDVRANGFLHHMVRNIVGALLLIGGGKRDSEWLANVLESRDRHRAGETAPPYGLYLVSVAYPQDFAIPIMEKPLLIL